MAFITLYGSRFLIPVFAVVMLLPGCGEDFLNISSNGIMDDQALATYEGVDALLIGAYSMLDGIDADFGWEAATSGWIYGSIRGLEANKGTDSGDSPTFNAIMNFVETPNDTYLNAKWRSVYESVARCNRVIPVAVSALDCGKITGKEYLLFVRQARALRGFYHFEAYRMWADRTTGRFVPFIDEYTDPITVSNLEDIRERIIGDLEEGTLLPADMGQVGRFNMSVCQVLLAKAYMQMYGDYVSALPLLTDVAENGTNPAGQRVGLEARFGDIFDIEYRNGVEAIYTVQYSVNDGSGGRNGGYGEVLNFPYKSGASPAGCCGFFQPTQDLVNSFRTDPYGLPYLAGYNSEKVTNDQGLRPEDPFIEYQGTLDPRLDWTVGRRGIPYWDWGEYTGSDWVRDQTYAGPYSAKKQVYKKSQEGIYTETGSWTSGFTANGYRMIRYADVLLLKAECEAETGSDDLGLGEVNAVRNRAANPQGFVTEEDGVTPAARYLVGNYGPSWGTVDPLSAIKFERRLELALEGHRYYDLQRWDEVVSELNRILQYEKSMEWGRLMYIDSEVGEEDVNYPVPQRQIDLSHGQLVQNR